MTRRPMWILAIVGSIALFIGLALAVAAHDHGGPAVVQGIGAALVVLSFVPAMLGWGCLALDTADRWREEQRRADRAPVFPDARIVHEKRNS